MEHLDLSILCAGFACIDIIKQNNEKTVMLGGTAANVSSILSLVGLKTEFLMAKYMTRSGRWLENALKKRGVQCVFFSATNTPAPCIIEQLNACDHYYTTICPNCKRNLIKCILPSLSQIKKISDNYNCNPNVFFFDRLSEGIKECAKNNIVGWNIYEPNSCRNYINLLNGVSVANIVKYSEERISSKVTNDILKYIKETNVQLLIVTMGSQGIKFINRKQNGSLSDWHYLLIDDPIDNVVDSSGSGDWLTAIFLYLFLAKYPNYSVNLDENFITHILNVAHKYSRINCLYLGAQGVLMNQSVIDTINSDLATHIDLINEDSINWENACDECYSE